MRPALQIVLFSVLLFVAGLALFTRANRFPFHRHPDEPVKVAQLQTGNWNFNHPMLLLSTARLALAASGTDLRDPQRVVEVGRWVSAGFAAATAALMAAALWLAAGRFAGIAVGLLILSNHQLFELSHYLKEDTALAFGLAAWLLGLALYRRWPGRATAAFVGAGAALALSGKYIGALAPLISLWLLASPRTTPRARRYLPFLAAFLATVALVNAPMLGNKEHWESSFNREVTLAVNGQGGMTRSVPHTIYFRAFRDNLHLVLWIFIALAFWRAWQRRRELGPEELALFLVPLLLMALLSFSPKANDRYFLPATVLFLGAAALGISAIPRKAALPALLAAAVAFQVIGHPGRDLRSYWLAFQSDDRSALTAWLNVRPPGEVIVQDRRTLLPSAAKPAFLAWQEPLTPRVLPQALEKYPDLQSLRAEGATLAALCQDDYERFDLKKLRPQKGAEETARRTGELYRAIRENRQPLWQRPRGLVIYLHPGLVVYSMPE
ncbi:MAG: hypothetical protein ACFUZC_01140 [Chthoniobacteraceae bacterium]